MSSAFPFFAVALPYDNHLVSVVRQSVKNRVGEDAVVKQMPPFGDVMESGMFNTMKVQDQVSKGNFLSLFTSRDRFGRFLHSILIGLPSWFVVGVLITFSPEFAKLMGMVGTVSAGNAVMYCYLGLVAGDLLSGILSQLLKSRKKVVLLFLYFRNQFGLQQGAIMVGCLTMAIALFSLWRLEETFHKDLDYFEEFL